MTRGGAEIIDDEIYAARHSSNIGVECPWPELSVGGQLEGGLRWKIFREKAIVLGRKQPTYTTSREVQALELAEVSGSQLQQTSATVQGCTRGRLVLVVAISGEKNESCSW